MATDFAKKALYGPPKVGGDILSYCTRCKMELAHVVASMIDTRPAKVICKTCRSQHNHRTGEPVSRTPSAGRSAGRPAAPKSVVRVAEMWEKALVDTKASVPFPYSPQSSFKKGDVVEHPKFGMGIIQDVKSNGKMTVLFRDAERVLVHSVGR